MKYSLNGDAPMEGPPFEGGQYSDQLYLARCLCVSPAQLQGTGVEGQVGMVVMGQ